MLIQYNELIVFGRDKKMIVVVEVGVVFLFGLLQVYQVNWLWFVVWGDDFINNFSWNMVVVFNEIYNSDYVLMLDEIQGWRSQ